MARLTLSLNGQLKFPNKLLSFEPTYASRYWILATILSQLGNSKNLKILDVGGKNSLLRYFDNFSPTILDIEDSNEPKFIKGNALNMPFESDEFDVVVSCDVLEHIPSTKTETFIKELIRVSKNEVIICAPFDNIGNSESERQMNDYFKLLTKKDHRWLKEHIDVGLPNEDKVSRIITESGCEYAKFRHFSKNIWLNILKIDFIKTALQNNPEMVDIANKIYKMYYEELCFLDFLEDGYRTYYIINKKGPVSIETKPHEEMLLANRKFPGVITDQLLSGCYKLIKQKLELISTYNSLMDDRDKLKASLEYVKDNLNDTKATLEKREDLLQSMLHSKSWKITKPLRFISHLILARVKDV